MTEKSIYLFSIKIEKLIIEELSEKELEIYFKLDREIYGLALAEKVTAKLIKSTSPQSGIYHSHRDYCGLGLCYDKNEFLLGEVNDGYMPPFPIIKSFKSESDFLTWLSNQSDQSMALYGNKFNNQTLSKIRLEWFLEHHYSPIWNDYCSYVREINNL